MSIETTNKKIKIDNGTTFGRTYTDKAVDELLKNVGGGLTLPQTTPSSQVIPSITTSNTQQNLTIGDGLAIENGVLKTTGSGGSGFNLYECVFNLDNENANMETMTLTEVGKHKLYDMFVNGKLLGINAGFGYFDFYSLLAKNDNYFMFSSTVFSDGKLNYAQINIRTQTGAIELIQKIITATDPA